MPPKDPLAYDRNRQNDRRANGLCVNCGKNPPLSPFIACKSCREKQKASKAKLRAYRLANRLCVRCGKRIPVSNSKNCSACNEKWRKHYWLKYGENYRERRKKWWKLKYAEKSKEQSRASRLRIKLEVFEAYGGCQCACCGEEHLRFLSIDHINGGGFQHRQEINQHGCSFYRWLRKKKFPPGYRVLCMNCQVSYSRDGYCPHQSELAR